MSAKLLVLVLPLVAVAFAATATIAVVHAKREAKTSAYREAASIAAREAARFEARQRRYHTIAHTLSSVLASYRGDDRHALHEMLHEVALRNPDLVGIYWQTERGKGPGADERFRGDRSSDDTGLFAPYWERLDGRLQTQFGGDSLVEAADPWYAIPKRTHRFTVIQPYVYQGVLMTSYVAPVLRDGAFVGVAGVDTSLASLHRDARRIHALETGYAFLVSNDGTFVSAPEPKLIGKRTLPWLAQARDNATLSGLMPAVRAGRPAQLQARDPFTGKDATLFAAPIATGKWSLVVVAPNDEILAGANRLQWLLIIVSALALAVVCAGIFLVTRRLTRPLGALREAADRIATGEIDVEIGATSSDEVGQTGDAFRRMVVYLKRMATAADRIADRDLTVEIEPQSDRDVLATAFGKMVVSLRTVVGDLSGAAETLTSSSQELASASDETGHAIDEIAQAVSGVAEGTERQARTASSARTATQETGAAAKHAHDVAADGFAAAEAAEAAMETLRSSSSEVTSAIRSLAAKSERIGGIVETITGIAGQTNLLALNAAIEAARAGEQGRGFAVVADEVRKLAEESQAAASSISALIAEIQHETERTVAVVESGARQTEDSTATVQASREAFAEIGRSVDDIRERIGHIAEATTEVAAVAEQASATTQEVSASTEETSAAAQQITASARRLAETADRLRGLVVEFRLA